MSAAPLATITKHRLAPLVNGAIYAVGVTGGFFLALFAGDFLPGSGPVTFAVGIGLVTVVVMGLSLLRSGPSLHLYEDRLVYESGHEFEVPYDDVEIVIARTRLGDRLLGTRTYEIVHSTGRNPNMMFMTDPDVFERIVGERVVEPREQYANRRQDARPFWQLWPDHRTERIPEGPIVTADGLEEAVDADLSDVDLDGIDEAAAMDDLNDFGDVEAAVDDSGDAGAFDDSDGGAGGVDGDVGGGAGAE